MNEGRRYQRVPETCAGSSQIKAVDRCRRVVGSRTLRTGIVLAYDNYRVDQLLLALKRFACLIASVVRDP